MAPDCILWVGRVGSHGYGVDGRQLAHRVAWREAFGPIPKGHQVHHRCEQKLCQNTNHMVLLTNAEHSRLHGAPAGFMALVQERRERTHCPQGHAYTVENTLVKRGKRHCRTCENKRSREYYWKNVERLRARMRERAKERALEQKGLA